MLLLAAAARFGGPRIVDQANQLGESLPAAIESVRSGVMQVDWLRSYFDEAPSLERLLTPGSGIMGRITGIFSSAVGVILGGLFVLFVGIFVAANPGTYVGGALHLLAADRRERAREVLGLTGRALRWWLLGRLASMVVVGGLTLIGLLIVDIPLALILALLAGLLSFVPIVGPVLAFVPAVLVGLLEGPLTALYVAIVYLAVQVLESNLITPLIQKQAVFLPPGATLVAQFLMAVLFGWIGLFLSTPLAVVVIVLVQTLYVEDVVGGQVTVLGQHGAA